MGTLSYNLFSEENAEIDTEDTAEIDIENKQITVEDDPMIFHMKRKALLSLSESVMDEAIELIDDEQNFPIELAMECMEYVGFIFHSKVLSKSEICSFYQLLVDHYSYEKILMPSFSYFHLLYRVSSKIKHSNYDIMIACKNKSNIVMIFHTNYDHVFSVFFHNILVMDPEDEYMMNLPYGYNSGLFLLRRQYKYGNYKCPRIINMHHPKEPSPHDLDERSLHGDARMGFGW